MCSFFSDKYHHISEILYKLTLSTGRTSYIKILLTNYKRIIIIIIIIIDHATSHFSYWIIQDFIFNIFSFSISKSCTLVYHRHNNDI